MASHSQLTTSSNSSRSSNHKSSSVASKNDSSGSYPPVTQSPSMASWNEMDPVPTQAMQDMTLDKTSSFGGLSPPHLTHRRKGSASSTGSASTGHSSPPVTPNDLHVPRTLPKDSDDVHRLKRASDQITHKRTSSSSSSEADIPGSRITTSKGTTLPSTLLADELKSLDIDLRGSTQSATSKFSASAAATKPGSPVMHIIMPDPRFHWPITARPEQGKTAVSCQQLVYVIVSQMRARLTEEEGKVLLDKRALEELKRTGESPRRYHILDKNKIKGLKAIGENEEHKWMVCL